MKNNTFFGTQIAEAARLSGVSIVTVYRHATGQRKITPEYAIIYNQHLGIPLSELRPDIWGEHDVGPISGDKLNVKTNSRAKG